MADAARLPPSTGGRPPKRPRSASVGESFYRTPKYCKHDATPRQGSKTLVINTSLLVAAASQRDIVYLVDDSVYFVDTYSSNSGRLMVILWARLYRPN